MRQRLLYIQNALETAPQNLTPEQLFQKLEAALLHIALLNERNLLLEEKIRLLLIKKYGSGAETLSDAQLAYAASDVLYLHGLRDKLNMMLTREGRMDIADACFRFLPERARLDLLGWNDQDIFSHE